MLGYLAASNQPGPFNSPSSFALLVEMLATGRVTESVLAAGFFGVQHQLAGNSVNSPYQVVKPMWLTANSTRVWDGSTA